MTVKPTYGSGVAVAEGVGVADAVAVAVGGAVAVALAVAVDKGVADGSDVAETAAVALAVGRGVSVGSAGGTGPPVEVAGPVGVMVGGRAVDESWITARGGVSLAQAVIPRTSNNSKIRFCLAISNPGNIVRQCRNNSLAGVFVKGLLWGVG
jgi:hypothetical protein